MMNLAEYRGSASRLADYLPWVALVATGVVLNKDGSFQRTAKFRGPDLDSAVAAELVAVASRINNAFRRLGGLEHLRRSAASRSRHLSGQQFPRSGFRPVDAERKAGFEEAGAHFVSSYFLTFLFLPPAEEAARTESGCTKAANVRASIRTRSCGPSPIAPTACWRFSTASCRPAAGSMMARR